jgi:hypothetical protein
MTYDFLSFLSNFEVSEVRVENRTAGVASFGNT